jgi:hypothetical protein
VAELKKIEVEQLEQIAKMEHDLEIMKRELNYNKDNLRIKEKEVEDLKENISRIYDDHSKELSKVMVDSRIKRKSLKNISSYSSSSLKDIEEAQGSSMIKSGKLQRQNSLSN